MHQNHETSDMVFGFHTINQIDESDAEFGILHKLIFDMVNTRSQKEASKLNDHWMTWKK
jgi:hypothetical protein